MNRTQIIVLGVSIVAFGAAFFFFNSWQSAPAPVVAAPKIETDQVLVAAEDIPMGTVMAENTVTWQVWPKAAISEQMIVKSSGPDAMEDVKGAMTRLAFIRGEPIRKDKLVKDGQGGFMSAILPSGMRAVAIKIDNQRRFDRGRLHPPQRPRRRRAGVSRRRGDRTQGRRSPDDAAPFSPMSGCWRSARSCRTTTARRSSVGGNATLELEPGAGRTDRARPAYQRRKPQSAAAQPRRQRRPSPKPSPASARAAAD